MIDDPAKILREHGVHRTAQRLALLTAVSVQPHCTADYVADEARAEIGAISRQAVYDALGILTEKGVFRRIQPAGSMRQRLLPGHVSGVPRGKSGLGRRLSSNSARLRKQTNQLPNQT